MVDACNLDLCTAHAVGDDVGSFRYHELAGAGDAARRAELWIFRQQILDAIENVQRDALCGGRIMFGDMGAQIEKVMNGFWRP